jgi:small conductance mechanosensitive channel
MTLHGTLSVRFALPVLLAIGLTAMAIPASASDPLPAPSSGTDVAELEMSIKHLTAKELEAEADRWLDLLKSNIHELNQAKIQLKKENDRIAAASSQTEGDSKTAPSAEQQAVIDTESARKETTLENLAELREARVKIIDRMNVVLDDLSAKLGRTAEDKEHELVQGYRLYINSVKELQVDVTDTASTWSTIRAWAVSEEGGKRVVKHLLEFVGIVLGFWILGMLLSRGVGRILHLAGARSQIMRKFAVDMTRRALIAIGLLLGLAAMEFNVTPLVAVIGAAGFVIAFALQDTLSNFASGLMIMLYRPFDIDDLIQTPDVLGKVMSMNLMTTLVQTPDNKLMVVPNNSLWGQVITNVTGSKTRRVDLVFGIGYSDDMDKAERVLREILAEHPLVLKEPEPNIRVSELGESSVNLICRPWVKTEDYWEVYWDVTRKVKERFDGEGISIPFPQRDLHIIRHEDKEDRS